MKYLFLALLISSASYALDQDSAAHLGMSYTINTIGYGICNSAFPGDRVGCLIMSSIVTAGIGAFKEYAIDTNPDKRDLLHDGLGIGLSIGTVLIFEWGD